jgi:FkbH-like protein
LRLEDFSCARINWDPKSDNISSIIQELNVGADSVVFIDDNPIERELVRRVHPELTVPDFPKAEFEIPEFFHHVCQEFFSSAHGTVEDARKAEQYEIRRLARKFREEVGSDQEFMRSLTQRGIIISDPRAIAKRISQMCQKTNQFNLTTLRLSEGDVLAQLQLPEYRFIPLQLIDRFGDHGVTALCILRTVCDREIEVVNFLVSCRILGRGVEADFLKEILSRLFYEEFQRVTARFVPSSRNAQCGSFLDAVGFTFLGVVDGEKRYVLNKSDFVRSTGAVIFEDG